MTNNIIALKNIVKSYAIDGKQLEVLKQISLTIAEGELLALVGASGSGKSTLMNLMGLLDRADSGEYWLDGENVANLSADDEADMRNHHIGFVFQQFNLLGRCDVVQNVALPLHYRPQAGKDEIRERVEVALTRVGMQAYAKHRPSQLSGGQQQRVAIARALIGGPKIILADEPTGALDSKTGREVLDLFLGLHKEGRTIIIVTHDEKVAAQTRRQITMADGQIQQVSCPCP